MLLNEPKSKIASIDVDAQNSFTPLCPDELPVKDGNLIVEELNQQNKFAAFRIGSKDSHPANAVWLATNTHPAFTEVKGYRNIDIRWPKHCVPGSFGFQLIEGLPHPQDYDFFVWKGVEPDMHPYGACFHDFDEKMSTGLIEFLKSHGVTTVIVGGLATDYCVKSTVLQLLNAGFRTIVNLGACRGIQPETTNEAVGLMKAKGATIINSYQDIIYKSK